MLISNPHAEKTQKENLLRRQSSTRNGARARRFAQVLALDPRKEDKARKTQAHSRKIVV